MNPLDCGSEAFVAYRGAVISHFFGARAPRRRSRLAVLVLGITALAVALAGCGSSSGKPTRTVTRTSSPSSAVSSSPAGATSTSAAPSPTAKPATVVKVTTINSDGYTYGVGMPVIAYFSKKITDAKTWQDDTKVTVNGKPLKAAWYFEPSSAGNGPLEAHLRPAKYWPAHASVHVQFPPAGTPLGKGFKSDGKLTSLDFKTGARHIALVDNASHTITVTSDGKQVYKFPVSLGATKTPTAHGVKVIMEKGVSICMKGPGYNECGVKYTQRLTYGGEYLHAAPWNTYNIGHGVNSSNGCTNMYTNDAKTLYGFLRIGDVVTYPNANGPAMSLGAGYGDWNLNWSQWLTGGAVHTAV